MSIIFNGREGYVQAITIYLNVEGYSKQDVYDTKETANPLKGGPLRKHTHITITAGECEKPDIYFDLYNERDTIYESLCQGWHLNDTSTSTDITGDKLGIETNGGLFRLIWLRKEQNSGEYLPVAEHTINMKNVPYFWIRSKNMPK